MGFLSTIGRALFVSVFFCSAWQQFNALGSGGGPVFEVFSAKFDVFSGLVYSKFGLEVPEIEIKYVIAAGIALKGMGSILFVLGCPAGAYILLLHFVTTIPISHNFEEAINSPELLENTVKDVALCGALILFVGMKKSIPRKQSKKRPSKSKTT